MGFFFLLLRFTSEPEGLVWNGNEKNSPNAVVAAEVVPDPVKLIAPPVLIIPQIPDMEVVSKPPDMEVVSKPPDMEVVSKPKDDGPVKSGFKTAYLAHKTPPAQPSVKKVVKKAVKSVFVVDESVDSVAVNKNVPAVLVSSVKLQQSDKLVDCGPSPRYLGVEMDRFRVCQWRNNCLATRSQSAAMLVQGQKNCVMSGRNPVACRDYFATIKQRTSLDSCNSPQGGYPVRRW